MAKDEQSGVAAPRVGVYLNCYKFLFWDVKFISYSRVKRLSMAAIAEYVAAAPLFDESSTCLQASG